MLEPIHFEYGALLECSGRLYLDSVKVCDADKDSICVLAGITSKALTHDETDESVAYPFRFTISRSVSVHMTYALKSPEPIPIHLIPSIVEGVWSCTVHQQMSVNHTADKHGHRYGVP